VTAAPDELARCYGAALRILQHRWNSAGELRRKLRLKEFDDDAVSATLERLTSEKWLDDERFAEAFVRGRTRKRIGTLRVRRELAMAGVDSDIIDRVLAGQRNAEAERATVLELAKKKLAILRGRGEEDERLRQKLSAYLARQGFETSLVIDVVRDVLR